MLKIRYLLENLKMSKRWVLYLQKTRLLNFNVMQKRTPENICFTLSFFFLRMSINVCYTGGRPGFDTLVMSEQNLKSWYSQLS